jgi:hypothetical protein
MEEIHHTKLMHQAYSNFSGKRCNENSYIQIDFRKTEAEHLSDSELAKQIHI